MKEFNINVILECTNCEAELSFTSSDEKCVGSEFGFKDIIFRVEPCNCMLGEKE